jgi:hypothetical protein
MRDDLVFLTITPITIPTIISPNITQRISGLMASPYCSATGYSVADYTSTQSEREYPVPLFNEYVE